MKTQSGEPIVPIQALGNDSYYIHKNITVRKDENDADIYEADTVRVENVTLAEANEIAAKISVV